MDRNEIQQILAFTREKIDQQLQDLEVDLLQKLECQSDYNKHTRNQVYINLTTTISYSEVEQLFFDYGTITMISIKANLLTIEFGDQKAIEKLMEKKTIEFRAETLTILISETPTNTTTNPVNTLALSDSLLNDSKRKKFKKSRDTKNQPEPKIKSPKKKTKNKVPIERALKPRVSFIVSETSEHAENSTIQERKLGASETQTPNVFQRNRSAAFGWPEANAGEQSSIKIGSRKPGLHKSVSLRAPSQNDFLVQLGKEEEEKINEDIENKLSAAARVVGAALYNHVADMEGRQSKPSPKKLKDSFEGIAAVSFMMDRFGLRNRKDAEKLGKALANYIICVSNPGYEFKDQPNYFYAFEFPVFMFKDKLGKELQTAIDVILGYPGSYLYNEEEFIQDTPLAKASVEICFDKKFKKKEIRYAVLYPNILKIFKNEQATEPTLEVSMSSLSNISVDDFKTDITLFSSGKQTNTPFIITYINLGTRFSFTFLIQDDSEATARWILMLDGLKFRKQPLFTLENATLQDSVHKSMLLHYAYKFNYKGGEIRSNEQGWIFKSSGEVIMEESSDVYYSWNGEFFQPISTSKNLGTGKWDGINLWWFPPADSNVNARKVANADHFYSNDPIYHYMYNSSDETFLCQDKSKHWKWSRHFLVSITNSSPEWLVEGFVPRCLVMFLQLMRYYIQDNSINIKGDVPLTESKILRTETFNSLLEAMSDDV